MARRLKVDRPVYKRISLPTSVVVEVELELFSQLEQRVPFAAWSELVTDLLRRRKLRAARALSFLEEGAGKGALRREIVQILREEGMPLLANQLVDLWAREAL